MSKEACLDVEQGGIKVIKKEALMVQQLLHTL